MIELLGKSSLILIVLYTFYILWLKTRGHFSYNRFILLGCLALCLGVHLIPTSAFIGASDIHYTVSALKATFTVLPVESENVDGSLGFVAILEIIYWSGVILLAIRLLTGLMQLVIFYLKSERFRKDGFIWLVQHKNISPTSFFNLLILSKKDLGHPQLATIVKHESCHRKSCHTLDSLFIELMTLCFWFHPCLWLIRKEMRECHEFEADRFVLTNGQNQTNYQQLLFEMRLGFSLIHGHEFSENVSLIKRFKMMKIKHNPLPKNKLFTAIGTFALIMLFSGFATQKLDTLPKYEEGEKAMYKTISKQIRYPVEDRKSGKSGTVNVHVSFDKQGEIIDISLDKTSDYSFKEVVVIGYTNVDANPSPSGLSTSLKDEAKRVIRTLGKFEPAMHNGEATECSVIFPITFKLD